MFIPNNFVVIDCETTGLDRLRCSLLSIGAVLGDGSTFYRECRPEPSCQVDREALAVNGYDPESWDHTRSAGEIVEELLAWLSARHAGRWIVGGKNPTFDYDFLEATLERHGSAVRLRDVISRCVIDLNTLVYTHAIAEGHDLADCDRKALYGELGLPVEEGVHHALNGARLAMEAFRALEVGVMTVR